MLNARTGTDRSLQRVTWASTATFEELFTETSVVSAFGLPRSTSKYGSSSVAAGETSRLQTAAGAGATRAARSRAKVPRATKHFIEHLLQVLPPAVVAGDYGIDRLCHISNSRASNRALHSRRAGEGTLDRLRVAPDDAPPGRRWPGAGLGCRSGSWSSIAGPPTDLPSIERCPSAGVSGLAAPASTWTSAFPTGVLRDGSTWQGSPNRPPLDGPPGGGGGESICLCHNSKPTAPSTVWKILAIAEIRGRGGPRKRPGKPRPFRRGYGLSLTARNGSVRRRCRAERR